MLHNASKRRPLSLRGKPLCHLASFLRKHGKDAGFTLLEMSIVLAIIAVVVGGGMTMFSASLQKREFQETQFKLKAIQKALLDYRVTNNRIPCPADVTLALTDPNFGVEAGALVSSAWVPDAGACTTSGTYSSDALTATASNSVAADFANGNNVEGMVPTTTLRLPDDYAVDGWGRRFMYVVDIRFTGNSAFTTYTLSTNGGLDITTGGAATTASSPTVIDNNAAGYSDTGWIYYSGATNGAGTYYNNDCRYIAAGSGSNTATWTFTVTPGTYTVAIPATGYSNHATNSPYSVYDSTCLP
jgi:prepilin-type N-terminal cleavage/methylation domain-containing protein